MIRSTPSMIVCSTIMWISWIRSAISPSMIHSCRHALERRPPCRAAATVCILA